MTFCELLLQPILGVVGRKYVNFSLLVEFSAPSTPKNLSLKYSNLGKNWAGKNEGRRRRSVNKFFDAFDDEKPVTYRFWSPPP